MRQTIENDQLLVEVDDHGAELVRIFDKEKQREVLWNGDPAHWNRCAPLLFPNVGRHWKDQYRVHGKSYPSRQHGFARDMDFTCVAHTADQVIHQLASDAETLEKYPFAFVLRVIHTLDGRKLTVGWEIENPNGETMYFTIGGHPAFRIPADKADPNSADACYENYLLHFPGKSALTYRLVVLDGSGTLDGEKTHTLQLKDGCVPLGPLKDGETVLADHMFDLDALVFDEAQFAEVQLCMPDGSPYIKFHCKGFPTFGIWEMPGAPFVCLEPWMGRADDHGYTGSLREKQYINALDAGKVFYKDYCIEIC